jgi:HEAT repeat protein
MRDPRAVEPLIVLLSDRFADVRHGAAWALGEIGDKRAVEPLRAASKDSDAAVRAQAEAALSKLDID